MAAIPAEFPVPLSVAKHDPMGALRFAHTGRHCAALVALFDAAAIALRSGATMAELNLYFEAGIQAGNG